MAQVVKDPNNEEEDNIESLGGLHPGDCFRFAHDTFERAIEQKLFWLVFKSPEKAKDGQKSIGNPETGELWVRDNSHRVVKHDAKLLVAL